jgi:purine-binding chemotaxis protein CheW
LLNTLYPVKPTEEVSPMGEVVKAALAAQAAISHAARDSVSEFLSFRLGAEEYGIDILRVQEIRGYDNVTKIANAPAFIKGVIDLRGVIVPIIDLRLKFALSEPTYDAFTVVIVLNLAERTVGVVVDSVSDVLQLSPAQIKPAPHFNERVDAGYLMGIATVKQHTGGEEVTRMLILMDIVALLSGADMCLQSDSVVAESLIEPVEQASGVHHEFHQ